MKQKILIGLLSVFFVLGICSCRPEKKEPVKYSELEKYPVTVENITLEEKPGTIVSLSAPATEILIHLGFEESLAAVSSDSVVSGKELPSAGSGQKPNFDLILSLSPDLVITDYSFPLAQITAFSEKGIKVLTLPQEAQKYEEILKLLNGNPEVLSSQTDESL